MKYLFYIEISVLVSIRENLTLQMKSSLTRVFELS